MRLARPRGSHLPIRQEIFRPVPFLYYLYYMVGGGRLAAFLTRPPRPPPRIIQFH